MGIITNQNCSVIDDDSEDDCDDDVNNDNVILKG